MTNILIIEDEECYGEFLKKIIEKKYTCFHTKSGIEAKELLRHIRFDIVVCDLRLPGILGKDLIHYVRREIDPDIVNIVVTGYEQDWSAVEATSEHVFFYLRKGNFRPEEFLKIIDNAAKLRDLKQKEKEYVKNLLASERLASTGKLAVGIAHEINNPLQCILLVSELLRKKLRSNGGEKLLSSDLNLLERGIERIRRVVQQLINLHKIDDKKKSCNSLNRIVEGVISFVRPIAKEKNIKILYRNRNGNSDILAPEYLYYHVLLNICLNLLDRRYSFIEIQTGKNSEFALIGIKTRKRTDNISQRLYAFSWLQDERLGLDISKNIVQQHGGIVHFRETDSGEIIIIKIPLSEELHEKKLALV